MTRQVTFGLSPCPNDTFQFYGLFHGKIDTRGFSFIPVIADVEELNRRALGGELAVTKASYGALGRLLPKYWCLRPGGALGRGCGPLWVTAREPDADRLAKLPIAHPGVNTTAHLLLSLRLGGAFSGVPLVFNEVFDKVASGEVPSGVIIHEGRFTYLERGLNLVEDLGEWWERTTGTPIPLGCILLRRDADPELKTAIEPILRESLAYAYAHREEVMGWVRTLAQELEDSVMEAHISLYVNEFSRELGPEGEAAVMGMLERQRKLGLLGDWEGEVFIGS